MKMTLYILKRNGHGIVPVKWCMIVLHKLLRGLRY